jgi:hypothetical protein
MLLPKNNCNHQNNDTKESETSCRTLANYNVLVLDQRFRKIPLFHLLTQCYRNGSFRDGNTALVWDLNKKNTYNLAGDFKYSYINAM